MWNSSKIQSKNRQKGKIEASENIVNVSSITWKAMSLNVSMPLGALMK
jgi:hypothetical protein